MLYADVLLAVPVEEAWSYSVPEPLEGSVSFGKRVIVPFGRRKMTGFVISVSQDKPEGDYEVRAIERVIDKEPVFTEELLGIAGWMHRMYFSATGMCLSAMIPSGRRESEADPFYEPASFRAIEHLSRSQEEALAEIRSGRSRIYYLFGITGSGKSEVYLRRAEDIISEGGQVLYMVPEITLTEQLSDEVYERFHGRVAILHSGLTPSQRLKAWREAAAGDVDLVIGARSSVFAPFRNLRLIILDEEHETSYKAGSAPRYHARQVAQYRAAELGAEFIMGSATPSLEAWKMMSEHQIYRIDLPERVGNGRYPEIRVVSMLKSRRNISPELEREMRRTLAEGKTVLLFLNRRGYTYGYSCAVCGHVITCPNCSVAMTYHKKDNRLVCHTCGYTSPAVRVCPECGSYDLVPRGFGTENIEEEARALFPSARIARLDADSASSKDRIHQVLQDFREGSIDILLGTQMIAKGLNFPLVSLVGVLNADSTLMLPDFRASERTFDLLHQVAGRAGRYRDDGLVIIQTTQPLAPAVSAAAGNDLEWFYREEMKLRKETMFPPFSRLIDLTIRGRSEELTRSKAEELEALAVLIAGDDAGLEVFSASPCPVEKAAMYYRYHVLLRSGNISRLLYFAQLVLSRFTVPSSMYLEVDTDPVSLM